MHVFVTLKDLVPIDWHYMTDRLQRVKNLHLCSTEETVTYILDALGLSR